MSVFAAPYTVASSLIAAGVIGFTLVAGGPALSDEATSATRPVPSADEVITVTAPRPDRTAATPAKPSRQGASARTQVPSIRVDLETAVSAVEIARRSL